MRRIIVLGGFGFFGSAAVELLRADGCEPLIGSRRADADVRINVEDAASIRSALRPADVVLDAAGPFQDRTTTLVKAAIEVRFDLVDISDSLAYVAKVYELGPQIDAAGISVLTACSSISAVSAAIIQLSGIREPVRLTGILAPASRYTAVPATGQSLLRSIGRPIQVLREGTLVTEIGWCASRTVELPGPLGRVRGFLFESADAITLPRSWPSLRTVDFYVHTNVPGLDAVFAAAARRPTLRKLVEAMQPVGFALARRLGSASGCLAYEIEAAGGKVIRSALVARERGYFTPVVPAAMAVRALAEDRFESRGLVPTHEHVDAHQLMDYLRRIGVGCMELTTCWAGE